MGQLIIRNCQNTSLAALDRCFRAGNPTFHLQRLRWVSPHCRCRSSPQKRLERSFAPVSQGILPWFHKMDAIWTSRLLASRIFRHSHPVVAEQQLPARVSSIFLHNHLRLAAPPKELKFGAASSGYSVEFRLNAAEFAVRSRASLQRRATDTCVFPPLDHDDKDRLLREKGPVSTAKAAEAKETLERLQRIAPALGDTFTPRTESIDNLIFRLIQHSPPGSPFETQSYVALSYRWSRIRASGVRDDIGAFLFPTLPEMYEAVLQELSSPAEGLWVDQISIKQHERKEKLVAVNMMDLIFQNARAVVVALYDIGVDERDADYLRQWISDQENAPDSSTSTEVADIVEKILRAEWFERAWCDHEMHLGRAHIFLVPVKTPGPGSREVRGIMRFTSAIFLALLPHFILTEVSRARSDRSLLTRAAYLFHFLSEVQNPGQNTNGRPATRLSSSSGDFKTAEAPEESYDAIRDQEEPSVESTASSRSYGLDIRTIARVFRLKTSGNKHFDTEEERIHEANQDKVSIILNISRNGITLNPDNKHPPKTKDECIHSILMLALAAGEPVSLCTGGSALSVASPGGSSKTWLFSPQELHITAGLDTRILKDAAIAVGRDCRAGEYITLDLGFLPPVDQVLEHPLEGDFAKKAADYFDGHKSSSASERDDVTRIGLKSDRDMLVRTLALCWSFGPEWMEGVAKTLYPEDFSSIPLQPEGMTIDLKAAGVLLEFVHFLCLFGTSGTPNPSSFKPVPIRIRDEMALVFVPKSGRFKLAVPEVLLAEDLHFRFLRRCWILAEGREARPWSLLAKAPLLGWFNANRLLNRDMVDILKSQRVYG